MRGVVPLLQCVLLHSTYSHSVTRQLGETVIVESELSKPLSALRRWGTQSCEVKRRKVAKRIETSVTWQDATLLDSPTSETPGNVFVQWCREHRVPPELLLGFLVLLCVGSMVVTTVYKSERSRRSQADMPGVEFGNGSWGQAYRKSGGTRREALQLMIQARVITPFELANDLTIVDQEHVEECISVAEDMLRLKPRSVWLEEPSEARAAFQSSFAATSECGLSVVDEETSVCSPEEATTHHARTTTPPRTNLTPRPAWAASPGLLNIPRRVATSPSPATDRSDSMLSESPLVDCGCPCPPSPAVSP